MQRYWKRYFVMTLIMSVIASFGFAGIALAADQIVISGGGSSRSLAIKDAMRNAIEKKVGVFVDATTIVRNARVLEDHIYTNAEGFIRSYDILEEWADNGYYFVKIRAIVDESLQTELMTRLQKVKIIETGLNDPRIGIALKGQNSPALSGVAVENLMIKVLRDNGFSRVIDMTQSGEATKQQVLYMSLSGQDQEALALMTQFGVDYMIVGNIRPLSGVSVLDGMFISAKVAVDARVYNVNTAQISFADTIVGTGLAVDRGTAELRAIEEAAERIGAQLSESLLKTASVPRQSIQLLVSTTRDVGNTTGLLESAEGVERVFFRSQRGNLQIFDITFTGDTTSLLRVLRANGFRVTDAAANRVQVTY